MLENEERVEDGFGQYDELRDESRMEQFVDEPVQTTLPKEKNKPKEKISIILGICIVAGIVFWCLWSGARGLFLAKRHPMEEVFNGAVKGDIYEGSIGMATSEYCSLKHTINLIPAGTEHFYLMYSPELNRMISVRAPKNWADGFGSDFVNSVSGQERGMIRELDYKVKQELSTVAGQLEGIQIEPQLYVDLMVDKLCYKQIFAGLSIVLCCIYFTFLVKGQDKLTRGAMFSNLVVIGMTALLFFTLGMLIYLLNLAW